MAEGVVETEVHTINELVTPSDTQRTIKIGKHDAKERKIPIAEKIGDIPSIETVFKIDKEKDVSPEEIKDNIEQQNDCLQQIKENFETQNNQNVEINATSTSEIQSFAEEIIPPLPPASSSSSRRKKAVRDAQDLLAGLKVEIDTIQNIQDYEKKEAWFETVFKELCAAEWDSASEEVSEILYKWGRFLLDNDKIEEGKARFWKIYELFPETRWYKLVFDELVELERPNHMVFIPKSTKYHDASSKEYVLKPYFIDKYPVTNAQYLEFVQATNSPAPQHWLGDMYPVGKANHPVVWVTMIEAQAYAKWRGKRIPTEMEWENAAQSSNDSLWPWGNQYEAKHCNCREEGNGDTTPVGHYYAGRTEYDCYDFSGNVWEWTRSWYDNKKMYRVLKGGSWFTFEEFTNTVYRNFDYPDTKKGIYGFRCCKSFKPSSRTK